MTRSYGRSEKGRLGSVLPSKRGTEDPDAAYSPVLGLPPRGDIAQGQYFPLLREMGESSQPLGWVSPWREPAGLLWKCIWNHNPIRIM